ncbi:MAG: chemotaxis-specific protein-glutamate methyltransferase CheB [Silicimonas sp.]|nr:chemotaxis-specific protein-glutamate methyltransferase CheB [Silicimonas sp.]
MSHDHPLSRPIRVVIVDDTRTIRAMIRTMLESSGRIEVVGEAGDPYEARELIRTLNPDVITLDIVMPRMDGLSFLERLMRLRPMPVVMVSSRTKEKSREAVTALSLGAVDCVDLGRLRRATDAENLVRTVVMAAGSNVGGLSSASRFQAADAVTDVPRVWNGKVVVVGSSTGGVDALLTVLRGMSSDCPPIVIAQHMPAAFLESFATRLGRSCGARVALAHKGARLEKGHIFLAPGGDRHVQLSRRNPYMLTEVAHDGSEAYVPSVNLLFASAVPHAQKTVGVMLTGMGSDGAEALLRMRQEGAHTIVQDSASAVIDGMPRSAREIGAAVEVAPLSQIGARIRSSAARQTQDTCP